MGGHDNKTFHYNQKIEAIQQELKQLSATKLEVEEKQSLLSRWLLPLDPKLKALTEEIEDLKEQRRDFMKAIQNAASVPKAVDYSNAPLYSQFLARIGVDVPVNQYIFCVVSVAGLGASSFYVYRGHHLYKMTQYAKDSREWTRHKTNAMVSPEQIESAITWINRFRLRGLAALLAPLVVGAFLSNKEVRRR